MKNPVMAGRKGFGIAFKFTVTISALIILMSFSFGYFISKRQINSIMAEFQDRAETLITTLAYNCEFGVLSANEDILDKAVRAIEEQKGLEYVLIYDTDHNILAHGHSAGGGMDDNHEGIWGRHGLDTVNELVIFSTALTSKRSVIFTGKVSDSGISVYDISMPVKTVKTAEGPEALLGIPTAPQEAVEEVIGVARIGLSLTGVDELIKGTINSTLLITLALMLAGIVITIFLVRLILKPIRELALGTNKVAEGDVSYRVAITTGDEIGALASSFNNMTESLAKAKKLVDERTGELERTNTSLLKTNYELEKITKELKAAQAQLIQSSKMTAIGQLGAGVAHELNNPIGGILGYSQFMLTKIDKPEFSSEDFKTCRKYLEHIERESGRCKTIVENLLTFSRKSDIIEDIDIVKVIESTLTIIGHQMQLKNIKIEKDFGEGLANTSGVANKLQQVFTNMMLNAQHAMPDGGTLYLRARNLNGSDRAAKIAIEIEDTGMGISEENLERIFEPFFTTKQDWKGTGLGLAITYQIIESMKGKIDVKSAVGKGTKFTITLPAIS
ncbi:MAG: hypothetical protein AUJ75_01345 [Candidatus Omnitrophica bacterium CG1_02_49_10]|nr:MAG: hypothetical protein AUJ75_01345 [Candidatus Omnitrophica bacterium CG1_02_49_10]